LVLWCGMVLAAEDRYGTLRQQLVADGFDPKRIEALFADPKARFDVKTVSLFFIHSEARLNYDQFTSGRSISKARRYMKEHKKDLDAAEAMYGVDKEIITGIILVETRLGKYLGRSSIFNTLATMAALEDKPTRERFWEEIPSDRRFARPKFEKKAERKSKWAYKELKAFLTYTAGEDIDPLSVNGSYAGAMGISQFMPSNILALAADGNQDGKIDLFNHTDAIYSVANYLKHHGWRPGLDRKAAYKVLLRYNYSKYYANTILEVADQLKG
jgi:membrane-bound lytic murein transglycosylase B